MLFDVEALYVQLLIVFVYYSGLVTGTYCGAHGVDNWSRERWHDEVSGHQVLVMIHQVMLDAVSREYIRISDLALIIIDECHHAVKVI